VARQLALTRGERVVRIRRVRLADGIPVSFDETYLPLEIGKRIITNDLKVEPIFALLERKYNVPLIEAEYKLGAVAAENEVAKVLKVKARSPIFRIERTSYSTGGHPVDYETVHYRGDLVRFVTRLFRKNISLRNAPSNAYEKRLALLPEVVVDRQRTGTTKYKRRKASQVEQVNLVPRRPKLGLTGCHTQQLDRTESVG
jgi:hypothetical protein